MIEFRHLKREFWGRHLWARSYFACTKGNVKDGVLEEYIENQEVECGQDGDFGVEGKWLNVQSTFSRQAWSHRLQAVVHLLNIKHQS